METIKGTYLADFSTSRSMCLVINGKTYPISYKHSEIIKREVNEITFKIPIWYKKILNL